MPAQRKSIEHTSQGRDTDQLPMTRAQAEILIHQQDAIIHRLDILIALLAPTNHDHDSHNPVRIHAADFQQRVDDSKKLIELAGLND